MNFLMKILQRQPQLRFPLFLFYLGFTCNVFAQSSDKTDSLINVYESTKELEKRYDLAIEISQQLKTNDPKLALDFAITAKAIAEQTNNIQDLAEAMELKARLQADLAFYDQALASTNQLDSLVDATPSLQEKKAAIMNLYGNIYVDRGLLPLALEYYYKSAKLHEDLENTEGIGVAYNNLGYVYSRQGKYDSSNYYHRKSLVLSRSVNNQTGIGYTYFNLGVNYDMMGDFDASLESFIKALNKFDSLNNQTMVASCYNSLGIIYEGQDLLDKALEYYQHSLEIKKKLGSTRSIAFNLSNMANVYKDKGDYLNSISFQKRALDIREELGDKYGIASSYQLLASTYLLLEKFDSSFYYLEKALPLYEEMDNIQGIASVHMINAEALLLSGRPSLALEPALLAKNHFDSVGSLRYLSKVYQVIGKIYQENKQFEKALDYASKGQEYKDSLFNDEKNKTIATISAKYETAKKQKELAQNQISLEQKELALVNQRNLLIGLVIGFFILVLIGYLFFIRYRLKLINKKLQAENAQINMAKNLEVREKTDDIINYFATSLYGKNTVDEILWDIVNNCIAHFGFDDCVIYLMDQKRDVLVQKAAFGEKGAKDQILSPIEIKPGEGIVGSVAKSGIAEIIPDTSKDPRYIQDDQFRLSEIAVPLLLKDKIIGVIDSEHITKNFYTEFHLNSLKTIASICASKIAQTQADEAEQQAKISQLEAEHIKALDQLKSEFFANISHEFRTPLNLILGPLKKAYNEITDEEFQMMERNASKLLDLVNQLLDLAKLEVGKLEVKLSPVDLFKHFRTLCANFHSLAQTKDVDINCNIPDKSLPISIDLDKLDKIIYNLISNAIKFTPEHGAIAIAAAHHDNQVTITIEDTGIGIPEEALPHIFDRFYQVDSSETRRFEGTGLGLALCKELVDLLGGTISIESQLNSGTKFHICLPVQLIDPSLIVDKPMEPQSITTRLSDNTVERNFEDEVEKPVILVVEDNKDLQEFISINLSLSFKVICQNNGEEGLRCAQEKVPDLIISDVMMPKMDGIEMVKQLRACEVTNHIPIILLTARDDDQTKLSGFDSGIDQFLNKPFDPNELRSRIENLLSLRQKLSTRYAQTINIKPSEITVSDKEATFIKQAIQVVEEHISNEDFSVEQLQNHLGLSRMQLHRKLKALTHQSASEFIRKIRLERAAQLLSQNQMTVAEVAYSVGFSHLSYFARCFKEQFGTSPSEYGLNTEPIK